MNKPYVDDRVPDGEREIYCHRMHNFLELLRSTGMNLVDAVLFRPATQIKEVRIDGNNAAGSALSGQKTSVEAVIPLERKAASGLRWPQPLRLSRQRR